VLLRGSRYPFNYLGTFTGPTFHSFSRSTTTHSEVPFSTLLSFCKDEDVPLLRTVGLTHPDPLTLTHARTHAHRVSMKLKPRDAGGSGQHSGFLRLSRQTLHTAKHTTVTQQGAAVESTSTHCIVLESSFTVLVAWCIWVVSAKWLLLSNVIFLFDLNDF